jgi:2-keto-3-deoxy-L-rhamnonate aldolase RhmA
VEVAANTFTPTSTTNPKSLKPYGLFLLSFSPAFAETVGLSSYDFVVVDMEHGTGQISDALSWLHVLATTSTPVIHRLPESSATSVRIRKKQDQNGTGL